MHRKIYSISFILILLFECYNSLYISSNNRNLNNLFDINIKKAKTIYPESCDSPIYCYGQLLDTIQQYKIFKDSKTFVDMPLKYSINITLEKFNELMETNNNQPSFTLVRQFVLEYFEEPGHELEPWIPNDWKENPKFLNTIRNRTLRKWGQELNDLWKILGRQIKLDFNKQRNPELHSFIPVEHPFIVPGGRFREYYYWDSYWIIRGLLYSEMTQTVRGMLKNFLSLIDRFGFIPNGGRVYYLKRSQPPLLSGMIKSYVDFTGDEKFAINTIPKLEREFNYFWLNYTRKVNGYLLANYGGIKSKGPRPESYREDIINGAFFQTNTEKEDFYNNIKAGAESGMDFSSRFFITANSSSNQGKLTDIQTNSIIPVELNAYLYWNAKIIADFSRRAKNIEKAEQFEAIADEIAKAIHAVLWNEKVGVWLDYDLKNKKHRNNFVPTNLSPLWVQCYDANEAVQLSKKILNYINSTGIDKYPGGVPNTLYRSSEQWDLPNVWPPMQYMLIVGLDNLGTSETKALAAKWAERWIGSSYASYSYQNQKIMFEKGNAEEFGGHGGGGEYETQIGFGWSNGVIIELLTKYGMNLNVNQSLAKNSH